MNLKAMNTKNSAPFTPFRDRDLNAAVFPPLKPTRFSTEPEGEGMEVCLRGLLVACLFAAMLICGVRLDNVAKNHNNLPALPDANTAVAVAQPVTAPVAKAL